MHLKRIRLLPETYPTDCRYPFNLTIFRNSPGIDFTSPVSIFVGENGTGKSTLLKAISMKCNIHIWSGLERTRYEVNEYEDMMYRYIDAEWVEGPVPGSFFAAEMFRNFAQNIDEWASLSPGTLKYYGGKSLMTQSHGQCHMSYFRNRFQIKGLYLLDEPENALSPKRQMELITLIRHMGSLGHAQFIIATHSPILISCPGSQIYSFDSDFIHKVKYKDTEHYKFYKNFFDETFNIDYKFEK